ncbi:MAG TPA: D-alanyl-D-alanine carboxypeptidase [Rhizomicrobium sp.]|nr:D-alanyl-D-alanine carboxypeptidase [Rhizomicrobium sp.]
MTKGLLLPGIALLAAGLISPGTADASIRHHHHILPTGQRAARIMSVPVGATDPDKDAALIVDGATGKVLYARNEMEERHPASLTKMMTLYMLFEALKAGKVTMETSMPVSEHAAEQNPTKLYLRPGQTINVDDAIRAIVIRSANDVAVVIAEALGGTELNFAQMMTAKAKQLGMRETYYHNASGLPDPLQITTASDLAVLARHLAYDFPQYFPYFALPGFTYKGAYYPTHDNLIGRYPGADGIKTGFTVGSGFNLTSSVVRDGVHLIGIVMGGRTAVRRDLEMMHLMDVAYAQAATNPTLVAHGSVPWEALTREQPMVAGFTLRQPPLPSPSDQLAVLSAVPPPIPKMMDEDAAEAHRAPDENFSVIHAEAPQLASVDQPTKPLPLTAVSPSQAANAPVAGAHQVISAKAGDDWTIQVGAYANQELAKAYLEAYAKKSIDLLGRAAQMVVPFQAQDGRIVYRARFGLFAEARARQVCDRLAKRGDNCIVERNS